MIVMVTASSNSSSGKQNYSNITGSHFELFACGQKFQSIKSESSKPIALAVARGSKSRMIVFATPNIII